MSRNETTTATTYSGSIGSPIKQKYCHECRSSCRTSAASSKYARSCLLNTTFPIVNAPATGNPNLYPLAKTSPRGPQLNRARPTTPTTTPARVVRLSKFPITFTHCQAVIAQYRADVLMSQFLGHRAI